MNYIPQFDVENIKFQENLSKYNLFINLEEVNHSVFGSEKKKTPDISQHIKGENSKTINEKIQRLLLE